MTKRKDNTNRATYCGRSHFKDQRTDSAVAAKIRCSGRHSMEPQMHTGHPGRLAPGATVPAACSGEQPVKTKSPPFFTHSQPLILIYFIY